jgi:hypothetical protein
VDAIKLSLKEISQRIYFIRGHRVMVDSDLASLYGVETRVLNQAVRRNLERFPEDFMFELNKGEFETLMSQIVISKSDPRGGRQKPPLVFTEQGVAMLSTVLKSKSAVHVNIAIMRTFVKLRKMIETHRDVAEKIEKLERKYEKHEHQFKVVFDAIREIIAPAGPFKKRRIGI